MKLYIHVFTAAFAATLASVSHATSLGFGQIGGSNTGISTNFGSNAVVDGNGYIISDDATPNVTLTWDSEWDVHTSSWFTDLENKTVGGGDWDNEGGTNRIAQLDSSSHSITFDVDSGYALVLNSFDIGHTAETTGVTTWDVELTDSDNAIVWSQFLTLDNSSVETSILTIAPEFTGLDGETYTLSFNLVSETYGSNGRHAIDNLTFSQVAIPEPSTVAAIMGLCVLVPLLRRRQQQAN
ncbi:PEP-CTERM sorting domain-containing protein [Cerasicoccus maritimus]|uniref:PEP-CTERM sorting domain-containing protein n=1 Tax=Cerasicoccus maritimus TaxID=490089 RepID=UPI002852ACD7|nr:PEP-CTERM sorting domain-containing protein [Cerasicoccus maritimus]